ncbi:MAG: PEP-CTERM sorting domain-containing protein, partial [Rubripirellula sp.]
QVDGAYGLNDVINYSLSVTNPLLAGGVLKSGTFLGDGSDLGLISFSNNNANSQRYIDNLVVSAVPEPSSLAALSVIGLFAGTSRFRRRKSVAAA